VENPEPYDAPQIRDLGRFSGVTGSVKVGSVADQFTAQGLGTGVPPTEQPTPMGG
jgi:hypothetical protein